jgi:Rhs element Vgr protein
MEELLIPNDSQHEVVTFSLLINDTALDPSIDVFSVSVTKETNRIPIAKISIRDGEASERNFAISNQEELIPGKKIKIKIGRDGDDTQIFKGVIVKHAIRVRENGNTELLLECRDESVKMTIGRHSRYFENMKDSQVYDDLIGRYAGLESDPEETPLAHKELVQHQVTDWDFMLLRAEANGQLVNVNDGAIKISKPDTEADPVLQVTYGTSILEFEAEMDARTQWKSVKATAWDYAGQQLFEADSSDASLAEPGNVSGSELADTINLENFEMHHSGHLLEQELQDWVNGIMLRSRLSKIRGRAKVEGFSGIKPGDMVKLEGVGDRFKGNAYVTAVKHEMGHGSWDTHIQFGLDPERYAHHHKDISDLQSAGLASAIHGLHIGKVVQLENDPDGEHRILVKIPVIDNNAQGIWTRVASLDAGSSRGAFFRPEIDDEVIVGFINDDPRHAVMLGMLHSSAKPAPITAQDTNHEKGFVTRSNMRIHFNDDTKTITIDTPAGNSIKLDEQGQKIEIADQNQNKATLSSTGVKIESPTNIEIAAGANLTLSAGASLSIGGVSLSIKADGSVSMEGAVTKISAQGITEVKGSIVKIN